MNNSLIPLAKDVEEVVDFVKTTLGPKGMDKLIISKNGDLKITNDGATILKDISCDSIASIIIRDICSVQDEEIGDGTTTVCCLVGELVQEAKRLVSVKINPQIIIQGYRDAAREALKVIEKNSFNNSFNLELFCSDLLNVAKTTLSSKVIFSNKEHFSRIALKAALKLRGSTDIKRIQIIKKRGGSLRDSFFEDGYILPKKMGNNQPKRLHNAKILIANTSMDSDKIKIFGAKVKVKTIARLAQIEIGEQNRILEKCRKIISHDINVFINRQLIYSKPEKFLTDNGLVTIEHADFEGIERLSLATGAEVVSTFDEPSKIKLGECKIVEEILIGEETMIRFGGCVNQGACTIVLRGSSQQILDETERSLHDTLCILTQVIKNPNLVWGGGCIEMGIVTSIEKLSRKNFTKKTLVLEAFSRSIQKIPKIIVDNSGFDSVESLTLLKNAHIKKKNSACLDITNGSTTDAKKIGLIEYAKLKTQIIVSAVEAVELIIRIDKMFLNNS